LPDCDASSGVRVALGRQIREVRRIRGRLRADCCQLGRIQPAEYGRSRSAGRTRFARMNSSVFRFTRGDHRIVLGDGNERVRPSDAKRTILAPRNDLSCERDPPL
jgi:hypothetical protein